MKEVKNIIFDFDGTLVDSAPLIVSTMHVTIGELGLEHRTDDQCRAVIGLRLEEIPAALFPSAKGIGKIFASTYRRIFDELKDSIGIECFPGVVETLKLLHANGYGMAIASSRSHRSLVEYVDSLGLGAYFSMIVGGDDVEHGKPSADPVVKILEHCGWTARETLTVGDAPFDILMGDAAHTLTCAVTYGNGTEPELMAASPDFVMSSFRSLWPIVRGVSADLVRYVERDILPNYDNFDKAHRRDHAWMVINQSVLLAWKMPEIDVDMAYVIAAFHDLGLVNGRENHHLDSGGILEADEFLKTRFSCSQIQMMKQAVEDHRASGKTKPRSDYGMLVADADRFIDAETIIRRTVQYGLANYPELDLEGHFQRTLSHLKDKYGPGGYLKVWLPWSDNAARLKRLHTIIADLSQLRKIFDRIFDEERE